MTIVVTTHSIMMSSNILLDQKLKSLWSKDQKIFDLYN